MHSANSEFPAPINKTKQNKQNNKLLLLLVLYFLTYPLIRLLSPPHPSFIPPSVFYPPIRLLSSHPPFILPSAFYPPIRLLSPHPPFILSSAFYPPIRLLSSHPPFIPPSAFYPPIRHPYPPNHPPSVFAFYPNPWPYCFNRTHQIRNKTKQKILFKFLLAVLKPYCLNKVSLCLISYILQYVFL